MFSVWFSDLIQHSKTHLTNNMKSFVLQTIFIHHDRNCYWLINKNSVFKIFAQYYISKLYIFESEFRVRKYKYHSEIWTRRANIVSIFLRNIMYEFEIKQTFTPLLTWHLYSKLSLPISCQLATSYIRVFGKSLLHEKNGRPKMYRRHSIFWWKNGQDYYKKWARIMFRV